MPEKGETPRSPALPLVKSARSGRQFDVLLVLIVAVNGHHTSWCSTQPH